MFVICSIDGIHLLRGRVQHLEFDTIAEVDIYKGTRVTAGVAESDNGSA